jgi:glycosyltransferase involved in cell wall biosynthesis
MKPVTAPEPVMPNTPEAQAKRFSRVAGGAYPISLARYYPALAKLSYTDLPFKLSSSISAVCDADHRQYEQVDREVSTGEAAARLLSVLSKPRTGQQTSVKDLFQTLRWNLRRWSLRQVWYRIHLPVRRRRWRNARTAATHDYQKKLNTVRTDGPAIVFGDFGGVHGLGRGAAYDAELLRTHHSSLRLIDIGPDLKGQKPHPLSFETPVENVYFLCQPDTYDVVCQLIKPQDIASAWRIGRWAWETPRFPEDWRFAVQLVHEVWAPSEFCAITFREALDIPVSVIPHSVVTPPKPNIDMRERLGLSKKACMGLAIMDITSCPERKNPWAHVRAWRAAFGNDPHYQFVLKLRVGKRTRIVLDELRELGDGATNIKFLTDDLSNEEIAALHHAADLFLSLHRSEGFGLNIYEALLLGKPVVATNWSANSEYGPFFPNYIPVPPHLTRYRDWTGHYAERDFAWATSVFK